MKEKAIEKEIWEIYEKAKADLRAEVLTEEEYARRLKIIIKKLKL